MVNDQEPRYRLVDADGSVVGSLFAESDGTLKVQEGTSGNDNELSLTTQGALEVTQLSVANSLNRVQQAVSQTIPTGSFTRVSFSTTRSNEFDSDGFDTTADEFVAPTDGLYSFSCIISITSFPSDSLVFLRLSVDGVSLVNNRQSPATSGNVSLSATVTTRLQAGDTVFAEIFQSSGSDQSTLNNIADTQFEAVRIG